MIRRFYIYFIGVILGIIISYFIFENRDFDFSYFPNARTLKHLRNQELVISSSAICHLNCLGIKPEHFKKIFQESDLCVNFDSSDVSPVCRSYHIEIEGKHFSSFVISDCDSISKLISFNKLNCFCPCP